MTTAQLEDRIATVQDRLRELAAIESMPTMIEAAETARNARTDAIADYEQVRQEWPRRREQLKADEHRSGHQLRVVKASADSLKQHFPNEADAIDLYTAGRIDFKKLTATLVGVFKNLVVVFG